ncbi:MAG: PilZ domain-containing protein [Proteobacteria bacterium]|nr:PilZ domain-containing protein [Pseudomonadota bacterium]
MGRRERDAVYQGPERRRHRRHAHDARAVIAIGPETYVFCDIEDLSPAGACLSTPLGFRLEVGEAVVLESRDLRAPCAARIVAVAGARFHCVFDPVAAAA